MLNPQYVWLIWASGFLVPWLVLFWYFPGYRRAMLWASLFTMPFGLTEPLFVPEYWTPPSLFDLAIRTGFDIESLIFCFGIGGVSVVLYNALTGSSFAVVDSAYRHSARHRYHRLAVAVPFIVFPPLYFLPMNPIYPAFIAMAIGTVAAIFCRPDLKTKTWAGGVIFTLYYWVFVEGLELLSPGYVHQVWNLADLSGFMIYHTPLEELIFAFTFGMYWAGVYEHVTWHKTVTGSAGHISETDS